MTILGTVLLVFFVIVAILLILLVLVQNEEGDSLGGIFAGGSGSAFGSRSGNILTRTTTVLGALFLIVSLGLALMNRTPGGTGVEAAGRELSGEAAASNWLEEELNPPPPEAPQVTPETVPQTEPLAEPAAVPQSAPVSEGAASESAASEGAISGDTTNENETVSGEVVETGAVE